MIKFEADPVLGYKDKEALDKLTKGGNGSRKLRGLINKVASRTTVSRRSDSMTSMGRPRPTDRATRRDRFGFGFEFD
jgi:hypothetical protein